LHEVTESKWKVSDIKSSNHYKWVYSI